MVPDSEDAKLERKTSPAVTSPVTPDATTPLSPSFDGGDDGKEAEDDGIVVHEQKPIFAPEEVLAQRYRIVRFIARGGMGEVYEAEDLTLRGRVALKTVLPEIARNSVSVERFKREISIARRITHPNVSRIYDLGLHPGPPETLFLTMEFLAGDTLLEIVRRRGPMSEREGLPLIEQIAAGMTAAHEAGVIHRDFKSANVMIVPALSGGVRAVVTDFGLARSSAVDDDAGSLSMTGAILGTPAYMAPEQVEGLKLTPAADIYALGIVLYEMTTGRRPFEGSTAFSIAMKRLTEAPRPPRMIRPSLDQRWNDVILHCLERAPEARFQSAGEVVNALREGTPLLHGASDAATVVLDPVVVQSNLPSGAVPSPILTRVRVLTLAAAVLTGSVAVWQWSRSPSEVAVVKPNVSSPRVVLRPAIAVAGFTNNTGRRDAAWLSGAISEMIASELSAGGKLRVASGQDVARVRTDLAMQSGESISADNLKRLGERLGVSTLVMGSYTVVGEGDGGLLRMDVQVVEPATRTVVASFAETGSDSQLFDLVSRAGGTLRRQLKLGELSPQQAVEFKLASSSNREAVRAYVEGLSRLRLLDWNGALPFLKEAVAEDRNYALAHASLSSAYSGLGDDTRAKAAAERAVALSAKLGREQKTEIEARLHEAQQNWTGAAEAHRSLYESYPDNIDYGLSLANALISGGKTQEAMVVLDQLRSLPLAADGRVDLAQARAAQEVGKFADEKKYARVAADRARKAGARMVLARALLMEASSSIDLGDLTGGRAAADAARELFNAAGDRGNAARALELTGTAVGSGGDLEGERRLYEQALQIYRSLDDQTSVARALLNIGTTHALQGNIATAQTFFDDSLATFQKVGAKYAAATALNNIGAMLFNQGELSAAEKRYGQALTLFAELQERSGTARTLTNIAEILECRGQLDQARDTHRDSLAINREIGDKGGEAYDHFRLGEIAVAKGEPAIARTSYEDALKLDVAIGDRVGVADLRVALAALAIDDGRAQEAEKGARESAEILESENALDRTALALAVVSDALLAQGRAKEALPIAERASKFAAQSGDQRVSFRVAVAAARARSASKLPQDIDDAVKSLQTTAAAASRSRFVGAAFEARLAACEIELNAGRASARSRLAVLGREASARGFGRIARRASASGV